jgi:hypothetical protein
MLAAIVQSAGAKFQGVSYGSSREGVRWRSLAIETQSALPSADDRRASIVANSIVSSATSPDQSGRPLDAD